jgi:hypothetical protein
VITFGWDPTGRLPDYTQVIKDERNEHTARLHGADQPVP